MQVDKKIYSSAAKQVTTSYKQTQKIGEDLAKEILKTPISGGAIVLCLSGNLGGGKTTFLQGFAKGLGVKEKILSPTFVIMKKFKIQNPKFKSISKSKVQTFTNFYHLDCYRLKASNDVLDLDFKNMASNPNNVVAIEWPEKIKSVLPKKFIYIKFKFIDESRREIDIKV
jgi:tRNA threonylcarbamoyladenosine biosynthesis protein TsaE